jgi:hypothetical protein
MNVSAIDPIAAHHELEARLYCLRLRRDLGDPNFDPAEEDAVLDEGEALWYSMTEEQRRVLEAERAVRHALARTPVGTAGGRQVVDVELDDHQRRGLPLLRAAG